MTLKIVYSFVVMDLPHWGHILHLKKAKTLGDILIVGVLDDNTVEGYKRKPIMSLEERMKIISMIKGVDFVILQPAKYPLENLKLLHGLFPSYQLICTHGDDWGIDEIGCKEYLEIIGGKLILTPYYKGQNSTAIIKEIRGRKESEL